MLRLYKLDELFRKWEHFIYPDYPKNALTAEQWHDWDKVEKSSPSRFFVAKIIPDFIEFKLLWPIHKLNHYWWEFKYRYIKKHQYHIVDTKLEPGYHDHDTVMIHSMFALLCNYVEEAEEQLNWSVKDPGGTCKGLQQDNAIETLFLYDWWKNNFLKRNDTYDESGWTECCKEHRKVLEEMKEESTMAMFSDIGKTVEMKKKEVLALAKSQKIEQERIDEEEEMMIRLIKIRKSMWV